MKKLTVDELVPGNLYKFVLGNENSNMYWETESSYTCDSFDLPIKNHIFFLLEILKEKHSLKAIIDGKILYVNGIEKLKYEKQ